MRQVGNITIFMPYKPWEYREDVMGRNVGNKWLGQWNEMQLTEVVSLGDLEDPSTFRPLLFWENKRWLLMILGNTQSI